MRKFSAMKCEGDKIKGEQFGSYFLCLCMFLYVRLSQFISKVGPYFETVLDLAKPTQIHPSSFYSFPIISKNLMRPCPYSFYILRYIHLMQTQLSSPSLPLELLASKYRTSKHETERRLRDIIRKIIAMKNSDSADLERLLREGKGDLMELKRELSTTSVEQSKLYDICRKRIHRHDELSKDENAREEFSFNAEIIQYLHGCQEMERAKQFQKAIGEEDSFALESDILTCLLRISKQIKLNELNELKRWIFENSHMLNKVESYLQFDLLCCEYVNLLIAGESFTAIMMLRSKLSNMTLSHAQKKIVEMLTLYLVSFNHEQAVLKDFLKRLTQSFLSSACQIYGVSFDSALERHLSLGISALKSICCSKQELRNQQLCPICAPLPNFLASSIPQLTKSASSLKCRINQSIMDEVNYPVALPSGHVYSISGLRESQVEGGYYCLVTQTVYAKGLAKKVFLA